MSNSLADDGGKIGLVRIEAQLGAAPDIGHMMQAILAAIGGGQHYAVDLVGAGGAMLYVVVEELIPEMSQGQHSNVGTVLFVVGFSVMMVLDVALG